ncbi:AbgT family transporter [Clostridium sp. MSJ-11]|uniref:AbgT family transporter n=1 Tax=Clostridium mobile TaxID=2841512 RepID=A0ABS6EKN4_9CLOT|nr:AbgT family transporter [Clostridium mobile]MBU5485362.1 AbgT family transporter [Clostridium mobile]
MNTEKSLANQKKAGGFLGWVERVGNKIPHPFILFIWLIVIVWVASLICSIMGVSVENPVDGKVVAVKNLLSGEGIRYMLENMIKNFTSFAPLGLVLTMTLGIGLAEQVGFMTTFMKETILGSSPKVITFMIMLIGICGNIASDAAIVVIPAIAAVIFVSIGRHPLAGIALGYASTTAGFSANLMIAGTDALLAGITTEALQIVNKGGEVTPVSNWFFMAVSTFILAIIGTVISEKIIEPRLGEYRGKKQIKNEEVTSQEKKGLRKAGIGALVYVLVILAVIIPKNSFLRDPKTGSLIPSPFLNSIIPLLLFLFIIVSYIYGKEVGKIKKFADVPKYMGIAIKDMASYIVLVFVIGQFIAYFNWSNLGYVIAVNGANGLKAANLTGIPLFILFILFVAFVNLFIGSGSAKWSLLAPIFVPMFYLLDYNPALTQMLYRIGDSTTNIISPLFPYFPIILALINEYDEEAGVGTVLSLMIPYSLIMLVTWIVFAMSWYALGLPLGPGAPIR